MILSGSLIPSDKYFLKNLTFVVRNPLVWLRHHSSQTLYQQEEVVMTSRPVGQEEHCFLVEEMTPRKITNINVASIFDHFNSSKAVYYITGQLPQR